MQSRASLLRPFGLVVSVLLATFAGVGPSVLANDTGNNGTVKVHEGPFENANGEVRNEPHVCTFHLHFYFADPVQTGSWEIQEWAPTGEKGTVVLTGTYDTAGDGEDRDPETGVYTLPDGHYKLFWDGDTSKHDKMKVFWVECPVASASPSGSIAPIESGSIPPSGSIAPSGSIPPSGSIAPTGSTAPSGSAGGGGELPIIGSSAPSGGVKGLTGTPPLGGVGNVGGAGATPPPTDTDALGASAGDDGWRAIVLGLAALIAAAAFLAPSRTPAGRTVRTRGRSR